MIRKFNKVKSVNGELKLTGDKSISHRALIFSAMASGESVITNLSNGKDVKTTLNVLLSIGAKAEYVEGRLHVTGSGYNGFKATNHPLDCGNSGTTARLIAGLLAAQNKQFKLIGDESLSKRPMDRVAVPLTEMGANIKLSDTQTFPMEIHPVKHLNPIGYIMPVASAQVKSTILIAGLHLEEETKVFEGTLTRNHTEKMLNLPVIKVANGVVARSSKAFYPKAQEYYIPGDISSAAFHIVLTLLTPDSELVIKGVSLNESRVGYLKVLSQMGGDIHFENIMTVAGEDIGDVVVRSSELKNIDINPDLISNLIDEIPILAVAGIFASGKFIIKGAKELRVKESDRINAICENVKLLGLEVNEIEDGFEINGDIKNKYPEFKSFGDHRIAMGFAVLSMLLDDGGSVSEYEAASISNPDFLNQLEKITSRSD